MDLRDSYARQVRLLMTALPHVILRLLWGQHAVLADLGAESNWHRIVFPLLKEPYRPV